MLAPTPRVSDSTSTPLTPPGMGEMLYLLHLVRQLLHLAPHLEPKPWV
jgi:hypothetical protein